MKVPTEKQYAKLRMLGSGNALVVGTARDWKPLLRRGWVKQEESFNENGPYSWLRITPGGLRALAEAVECYGLPDLHPVAEPEEENDAR